MRHLTRLTAILLCIAMLLSLIGCGSTPPAPTEIPTEAPTEAPTEPPVQDIYAAARDASTASPEFLMNVTSTQIMRVAGQTFTTESDQTIYYADFGTDAMAYRSSEDIRYGESSSVKYEEIFKEGTLYVSIEYSDRFRGEMTTEDALLRQPEPGMLDPSLYATVTADENGTVRFADPTAAESWAMPEGAKLTEASAEAVIGTDGKLASIHYSIRYTYGPAEYEKNMDASLMYGPTTINAPSDADKYILLQDIDVPYLVMDAQCKLMLSDSVSTGSMESIMSQAAGVVQNQSVQVNMYIREDSMDAKVETGIFFKDYSTNQEEQMETELLYTDGICTLATDDQEPKEMQGVTEDFLLTTCATAIQNGFVRIDFWENAKITDLGSLLLLELSLNNDYATTLENAICSTFWNDPNFLRNLSSEWNVLERTGYVAIDKFTGLPTSAGHRFEASHTIQGQACLLNMQTDLSIDAASLNAYFNVTDELLPEEEPENKATPLFYHVTGENGQQMWLLGTIHVGDVRTGFLPQEIYDAFAASDALALEYDSDAFDAQLEEDDKLQEEISNTYYYSDGTQASDHVEEETYDLALQYMKATGNYNMNTPYLKLSMWGNAIENFYLRQGGGLNGIWGVEERLTKLAHDQGKEIRSVESAQFQINMLTGWSEELQAELTEDALDINAMDYAEGVADLYEKWCAGDEAALREELSDEVNPNEMTDEERAEYEEHKHLIDEYNKAMSYDRNDGMLQVAIEYLESGDVVFYAVGLAHLLNNVNGLVDTLREAGYTVELVQYAQ